jgi:membrane fusion protein (multidrug efflux system)
MLSVKARGKYIFFSRILLVSVCAGLFSHIGPVLAQSVPVKEVVNKKEIEIPGRAVALHIIEIIPQVRGIVTEAVVKVGQRVKKGDLLIKIDPRAYQHIVDRAEAKLKNARVKQDTIKKELVRIKGLVEKKLATTSKLYGLSVARDLAEGSVEEAEAELKTAKLNLSYTVIKSPIDGFISEINTDAGNFLGQSNEPALVVLEYNPIKVIAGVEPELALKLYKLRLEGKFELGEILLKFSDGTIYQHPGEYVGSSHQVNRKTGKVNHLVMFPNADLLILPGSNVTVIAKYGDATQ